MSVCTGRGEVLGLAHYSQAQWMEQVQAPVSDYRGSLPLETALMKKGSEILPRISCFVVLQLGNQDNQSPKRSWSMRT
jgi:hypothetical protein